MMKQLVSIINQYNIQFKFKGIKIDATVDAIQVNLIHHYDHTETDIIITSIDGNFDKTLTDDISSYIIDNWNSFK